jgi:hypothetical protein
LGLLAENYGALSVGGFAHQFKIFMRQHKCFQTATDDGMIVHQDDSDPFFSH